MTDPLLKKSHAHKDKKKEYSPFVCPGCEGKGHIIASNGDIVICFACDGEGELWDDN